MNGRNEEMRRECLPDDAVDKDSVIDNAEELIDSTHNARNEYPEMNPRMMARRQPTITTARRVELLRVAERTALTIRDQVKPHERHLFSRMLNLLSGDDEYC